MKRKFCHGSNLIRAEKVVIVLIKHFLYIVPEGFIGKITCINGNPFFRCPSRRRQQTEAHCHRQKCAQPSPSYHLLFTHTIFLLFYYNIFMVNIPYSQ